MLRILRISGKRSVLTTALMLLLLSVGSASAAVTADRFGGFEDSCSYGEGAGKAAPGVSRAYEAIVVAQRAREVRDNRPWPPSAEEMARWDLRTYEDYRMVEDWRQSLRIEPRILTRADFNAAVKMCRELQQRQLSRQPNPSWTTPAPSEATDLAGTWKVVLTDPYATYTIEWKIEGRQGSWTGRQILRDTTHSYHKQRIGQELDPFTITASSDNPRTFIFKVIGGDPNPGNAGHFEQLANLVCDGSRISGEGTHKGSSITHWFRIEGTKQ